MKLGHLIRHYKIAKHIQNIFSQDRSSIQRLGSGGRGDTDSITNDIDGHAGLWHILCFDDFLLSPAQIAIIMSSLRFLCRPHMAGVRGSTRFAVRLHAAKIKSISNHDSRPRRSARQFATSAGGLMRNKQSMFKSYTTTKTSTPHSMPLRFHSFIPSISYLLVAIIDACFIIKAPFICHIATCPNAAVT